MRNILFIALAVCAFGCNEPHKKGKPTIEPFPVEHKATGRYIVSFDHQSNEFNLDFSETGRYKVLAYSSSEEPTIVWLEDYIDNTDGRTYNITGNIEISPNAVAQIDGSPIAAGEHKMRVHTKGAELDSIVFELLIPNEHTPLILTQKMEGEEWELVWSDEFEEGTAPDESKWTYRVGNWGWGNNELQFYTANDSKNARIENGNLIIEAHKNKKGNGWTSARLTTQGKTSFKYGKIEYRAKVPVGRGTWAAGWMLGDTYQDEISWPYCGEIDVLECVGYEIDDKTGEGINHATCHTPAYYFKKGNQIGSEVAVQNMDSEFHTFAVEWYPDLIKGYLDGEHYYTYDKTADELEWPFHQAQNIIINLAIGGGWGGAQGIDSSYKSHQYILDYVRVYGRK